MRLKAYTLVEVILTISIISLIGGLSVPIYQDYQKRNEVEASYDLVKSSVLSAQTSSQAGENDSAWGVYLGNHQAVVFNGNDYASRDPSYDITYDFSSHVSNSGLNEIVFEKFTGNSINTGTITLSNEVKTLNITINSKGAV